jgi:hypothetical protein
MLWEKGTELFFVARSSCPTFLTFTGGIAEPGAGDGLGKAVPFLKSSI